MYKLITYYRSASSYPANARIIQRAPMEYALFIQHDTVGTVLYRRGSFPDLEKELFSFIPYGYIRPIFWKKVTTDGN